MAITFLPYGMVVYSYEMGLGRSVEAKPSFMTLGSAVSSDRLELDL